MRAPKDDSLINRTLFNHDAVRLFTKKNQTKNNPQQQLEAEKRFGKKQFVNPRDTAKNTVQLDSDVKSTSKDKGFGYQNRVQEANFATIRTFFYFKEFLTDWLKELSVRPTQISVIFTATLYLIAISSTVQKRDGHRWLKSLLNAKLPGYTTLYQDSSWETFRNYTFKCLLENNNLQLSESIKQDGVESFKRSNFKQSKQSSFKTQGLNGSAPIDGTELHPTTFGEEAIPVKDVETEKIQFLNSPLGRGDAMGFEKRQFVDLYKDKALIHLRSPWEKGIRKDFVGFFVKRQLELATQAKNNTNKSGNHVVLPWYRIDACNRPDRVVLATPQDTNNGTNIKESTISSKEIANSQLNKQKYLRNRREQSVLSLRKNPKRFALAQKAKIGYATDWNISSAVPSHSVRERILGLEYIFPFHMSKGRVYAQNDSIPLKLESAYSLFDLLNSSSSVQPGINTKTASILEAALLTSTPSKLKAQVKNESFIKNNQLFFGKNFYSFQKRLRELFYWYGLFPPYNLMELIDPKAQFQVDKEGASTPGVETLDVETPALKSEIQRDNLKENYNSDHTRETTEKRFIESSLPQIEEETEAENSLHKEIFTNNLTTFVFQEFEQKSRALLTPNNTILPKFDSDRKLAQDAVDLLEVTPQLDKVGADSGFAKLFSNHDTVSSPNVHSQLNHNFNKPQRALDKEAVSLQSGAFSDPDELNTKHIANALSQPKKSNLGIKHQIENLIDEFADQSGNFTDSDQLTSLEQKVSTPGVGAPGAPNVATLDSTLIPITVEEIGSKNEKLQQTLAQFAFKHWPLLANVNSFAQAGDGAVPAGNRFEKSDAVLTRLMSGYKFPDCTKTETDRLFREFVLPHLFVAGSVSFSHSYLINQTLLRPLYIKLPPALPFAFFEKLALSLYQTSVPSTHKSLETVYDDGAQLAANGKQKNSHINIEYKRISLQELAEVKDVFVKLGKDYKEYLSLPKDSPPALRISPSLEDDTALKQKAEQKEKRDEERVTPFERLQKIREREARFELGKELRPFAYKNQFAFHTGKMPSLENSISENSTVSKVHTALTPNESSHLFPRLTVETPAFTKQENSWINFRLGQQNLLSDRKHSFFGRKKLLTKRLVAQEQKEIDEQISKNSYTAPDIKSLGKTKGTDFENLLTNSNKSVYKPTEKKTFDQSTAKHASPAWKRQLFSNRKLQKRARKGLIKLLGSPELSAHNVQGSLNRTRRANGALRGKVIKSAYSHLRWQKKRFRSRMLGTPSNRHLVMPEISSTDWKKMLEWQLKNYFFLEKKRLDPLKKEDPEKNFKIRQLHIYLPWVTVRTASNKPFQWPYTRLDYADCIIPAHIYENTVYELPEYKAVSYWDSGKSVSLSVPASSSLLGNSKKSRSSVPHSNGIRIRAVEEVFLCEPLSNQSWLLLYRLFLAFALQNLLKYVYRVSLKRFIIEMANSDFGLRVTSSKFREWLEHARPKPFYTPKKRLRDVAAIEESIPILSEIVWYLRNFGRGRAASRGFLLVGPAGAEKTSVVQAIAGECRLPVVVQSISALALTNEDPYEQLENVFTLARQQAPCVLFLDDLDVVGQSRADVVKNDIGPADLLFSLDTYTAEGKLSLANLSNSLHTNLLPKGTKNAEQYLNWQFNPLAANPVAQANMEYEQKAEGGRSAKGQGGGSLATLQQNQESQTRRLNLLLRLLTEMDGVAPLNGVVILATSEQPALLDPALLRAGRFERRIHLSLPNKERRIQLFKAGTQKIGCMQSIPWDYLGIRTTNMSGADIASAINHSAIRAILDNTVHTVESLEHGLNFVNGLPNKSSTVPVLQRSDPFHYSRLAFYQAGKAVVHNLLLDHPELGFCSLNDATINQNHISGTGDITRESLQVLVSDESSSKTASVRSGLRSRSPLKKGYASLSIQGKTALNSRLFDSNLQSHKSDNTFSARTRVQFETRLVGLYAGKAAELLHLSGNVVSYRANPRENRVKPYQRFDNISTPSPRRDNQTSGWLWQSNLGFSELLTASSLLHLMIDRWYLYSQKLFTYKINKVMPSLNHEQIRNETLFPLARRLSQELEFDLIKPNFWGLTSYTSQRALPTQAHTQGVSTDELHLNKQIYQERIRTDWWQAKVCQALEMVERPYGKWYRIYLPKIEEREQNKEWVPPDTVFHQSLTLSTLTTKTFKEKSRLASMPRTRFGGVQSSAAAKPNLVDKKGYTQPNRLRAPSWLRQHSTGSDLTRRQGRLKRDPFPITQQGQTVEQRAASASSRSLREAVTWKANINQINSYKSVRSLRFMRLHLNSSKERIPSLKTLNDLYLYERDSAHQKAVMNCFFTAFSVLNENRELLDSFADHLIRFKILRSHEISKMCSFFSPSSK